MSRVNQRLEIVRFDSRPDVNTGYRVVQVAIDGHLAVPMDIHDSDYLSLSTRDFEEKLLANGEALLRYYGDARMIRHREDGSYISLSEGSDNPALSAA